MIQGSLSRARHIDLPSIRTAPAADRRRRVEPCRYWARLAAGLPKSTCTCLDGALRRHRLTRPRRQAPLAASRQGAAQVQPDCRSLPDF
jgi:hypothetical protein